MPDHDADREPAAQDPPHQSPVPPPWMRTAQHELRGCGQIDEVLTTASHLTVLLCRFDRAIVLSARGGHLTADSSGTLDSTASESLRRAVLERPVPLRGWNEESVLLRPGAETPHQSRPPSVVAVALGLHHYVLAPLVPESDPIGLLVADRSDGEVTIEDRSVVRTMAYMTAIAIERLVLRNRLADVKGELRHLAGAALGVVDELTDAPVQIPASDRFGTMFAGFSGGGGAEPGGTGFPHLTPRDHRIAQLISRGLSNRAMAHELHLAPDTVKGNVATVLRKLGVNNRAEAAARYARRTAP